MTREELIDCLGTIAQSGTSKFLNAPKVDSRDRWRWGFQENGDFTVNVLTKLVEEKTLNVASEDEATIWNKWVPKKVQTFSCGERFKLVKDRLLTLFPLRNSVPLMEKLTSLVIHLECGKRLFGHLSTSF
nr:heat shock protein 90-5, chloroplastic-like [Tanacetum cinerariifolium]